MKPKSSGATPPGSAGPLCVAGHSATSSKLTGVTRHDSINHKSRTPTPVNNTHPPTPLLPKPHTPTPPLPTKSHTPTPPISTKTRPPTPPTGLKPPLAGAYSNFQIAKQLHRENLQHRPLPDTVDDKQYRALEANRAPYPGKGLQVEPPRVSAVGYRGYGASGPSQCSKLRVYRPKTAVQLEERKQVEETLPRRPSTGRVSDMQLAICWDLKPPREEDEPRPSAHIDGSNGSVAPAVFALVRQPSPDHGTKENGDGKQGCETKQDCVTKEGCETKQDCGTKEGCNTPPGNGESIFNVLPKSAWGETKENNSPNVGSVHRRNDSAGTECQHTSATLERRKEHQSSPNLMTTGHKPAKRLLGARPCMACELKQLPPQYRPRSEYKMAFKAGKPSNSFDSGRACRPQTAAAKQVHVPKPRAPFAKRSYSIDTLRPPFSLWPGHMGQGYPEHWRLASVYQHAYKPVEARRKPLLASVYQ
ncbi:uncharacterized protein LOC111874200 [Cryptotermes secundus]|uniref:uncharacterized protein LOC111874200 n=1 Tax=Cryptotermes secundus TaxID=105785 RepID=UPI000CD7C1FA|nr:uncharacterized protein LOC111874200 [Cryptotermes secundus]XP_023725264.1 uncharacterized protein LOC111874200 [Cryptotermes secundus]XP_023725265.1 uncharacterized protein LOC111874200 [Cryptotermes secundus]XP_033611260.1 uncharacterized protein LOC111874200 [Cryptotermes secundus]XP_033611261.1 uncharacterized protein LOC111874200 [Cryptotermes secundus]